MRHFVRSLCLLALFSFSTLAQEPHWNQWRGPNSTNHSFSTGIANSWGEEGPKLLWKVNTVGNGYSSVSLYGDTMFTMGDLDNQCYVFALDRNTGKEIWRAHIGKGGDPGDAIGRGYPGTLATPACDGETVYAMSQFSEFAALDVKDGSVRWRKNTETDLDGKRMSGWGYSQSPIIDGDKIILPIGGEGGTLAAFNKSGELLWRSAELKDSATHVSVVPVEIAGVRQYLLLTGGSSGVRMSLFGGCKLAGISTDGKILWQLPFPGRIAVCSDPVLCGDVVMTSAAYGTGAYFYRITKDGDQFKAEEFHKDASLVAQHGGIVAVGDHFYLLTERNLACVEAKTGKKVWENRSVGKGSLTYVDGKLIARSERGPIALVEATPEGYKELGKFQPVDCSERQTWAYPVVADKKLYIRDHNVLLCYDLQ